ncbi:MAG TPA: hypothetical protein VE860_22430 [Chthoniobacterales bacterium]|nr:hypothetical protein [Chthoniobacterales bacterium]
MVKFCEELTGTNEELLRLAKQFELEGLIAKRPDSLYEPGRRSGAWVKIKLTGAARVRHRRLHPTRRQPQILWRSACRLLAVEGATAGAAILPTELCNGQPLRYSMLRGFLNQSRHLLGV